MSTSNEVDGAPHPLRLLVSLPALPLSTLPALARPAPSPSRSSNELEPAHSYDDSASGSSRHEDALFDSDGEEERDDGDRAMSTPPPEPTEVDDDYKPKPKKNQKKGPGGRVKGPATNRKISKPYTSQETNDLRRFLRESQTIQEACEKMAAEHPRRTAGTVRAYYSANRSEFLDDLGVEADETVVSWGWSKEEEQHLIQVLSGPSATSLNVGFKLFHDEHPSRTVIAAAKYYQNNRVRLEEQISAIQTITAFGNPFANPLARASKSALAQGFSHSESDQGSEEPDQMAIYQVPTKKRKKPMPSIPYTAEETADLKRFLRESETMKEASEKMEAAHPRRTAVSIGMYVYRAHSTFKDDFKRRPPSISWTVKEEEDLVHILATSHETLQNQCKAHNQKYPIRTPLAVSAYYFKHRPRLTPRVIALKQKLAAEFNNAQASSSSHTDYNHDYHESQSSYASLYESMNHEDVKPDFGDSSFSNKHALEYPSELELSPKRVKTSLSADEPPPDPPVVAPVIFSLPRLAPPAPPPEPTPVFSLPKLAPPAPPPPPPELVVKQKKEPRGRKAKASYSAKHFKANDGEEEEPAAAAPMRTMKITLKMPKRDGTGASATAPLPPPPPPHPAPAPVASGSGSSLLGLLPSVGGSGGLPSMSQVAPSPKPLTAEQLMDLEDGYGPESSEEEGEEDEE